ncbi:hypothetical protein MUA04_14340 [Enterobacteriaceae bacterium H11S18]|uniref:hypothetical protein n=1 Tax=Dryocola clanedunensis TaxID=2925396 RepID=UPI0022F11524|nr:hypothetical protein [Dryocola clanedunensis]MCT4711359.1 hypothetical protein [Dryocola clanedunensis]
MRCDILMNVEKIECAYDKSLDDDVLFISFVCETPLNETDTCEILARHFDDGYFEETEDDTFTRKNDVYEMRGKMRLEPSYESKSLTVGKVIIPVTEPLLSELTSGNYDGEAETDISELVQRQLGDLFDEKGKLIIHK